MFIGHLGCETEMPSRYGGLPLRVGVLARQQTFAYAVSLSRKLKSFAFRSLIRTFGFAEGTLVDFVFKCHDSTN